MDPSKRVQIFSSFEEENQAERQRQGNMTPEERCREFSVLQERRWGKSWTEQPMEKVASYEMVSWWKE
jgi:hypothetical protein